MEVLEWRLSIGEERKGCLEECGRKEERLVLRMVLEEIIGFLEILI